MTRTGKIARLPRALRDTLNRRLLEGEPGPRLLAWLNKQPETKAVLAEDFDGRAVTAQNLSEWRLGGFGDWCREQSAIEAVGRTLEEGSDFEALAGHGLLPDRFAPVAAVALNGQLRAVGLMAEGPEKVRATLAVVAGLVRLRASDRQWEKEERARIEFGRELEDVQCQDRVELARLKLKGERLLTGYTNLYYHYNQAVEEALAEDRLVPEPVLEFLAAQGEFERRHVAARDQLEVYLDYRHSRVYAAGEEWGKKLKPGPLAKQALAEVAAVARIKTGYETGTARPASAGNASGAASAAGAATVASAGSTASAASVAAAASGPSWEGAMGVTRAQAAAAAVAAGAKVTVPLESAAAAVPVSAAAVATPAKAEAAAVAAASGEAVVAATAGETGANPTPAAIESSEVNPTKSDQIQPQEIQPVQAEPVQAEPLQRTFYNWAHGLVA